MINKSIGLAKILIKLANILMVVALVGVAMALVYVSVPTFGNKAMIVRSGSMQPAIGVGDLVVVRAKEILNSPAIASIPKYKTGDIIAFKAGNGKTLVTHRIASVKVENDKDFYETKGDANKTVDRVLVNEENIIGAKFLALPKVGKIIAFTKSNIGFPLLVIFPAVLVIIFEIWAIFREVKKQKIILRATPLSGEVEKSALSSVSEFSTLRQAQDSNNKLLNLKVLLPIFMTIFVFHSAFAFFSDSETSTNNSFVASSSFPSPSPTPPPIAQTLVVNEFLWNSNCGQNATAKARNYWIELYNGSASTVDLKDWRFHDANNNIIQISNAQKLLDPGEYIVITKDGSVFSGGNPCYVLQGTPEQANLGGNQNFLPATTGGVIRLEEPDGSCGFIVVDRIEYGPSQNSGALDTSADQSIARSPNGVDSALGDTFAVSDFALDTSPSPGVAN